MQPLEVTMTFHSSAEAADSWLRRSGTNYEKHGTRSLEVLIWVLLVSQGQEQL